MRVVQCSNGHYYDADKYEKCPHCDSHDGLHTESHASQPEPAQNVMFGSDENSEPRSSRGGTVLLNPSVDNSVNTVSRSQDPFRTGISSESSAMSQTSQTEVSKPVDPIQPAPRQETLSYSQMPSSPAAPQPAIMPTFFTSGDSEKTMMSYTASVDPVVGWLVGLDRLNYGVSYNLIEGKNFIGRDRDMDVALTSDGTVSRQKHAVVIFDPSSRKFIVREGESKGLVYLNDELVMDAKELKNGDVIKVGESRLRFVPLCGQEFSWDQVRRCSRCGVVAEPDEVFCSNCGAKI